jgi:hypothetical protein
MAAKLNQILAVEKGLKNSSHDTHGVAYQTAQKPQLFNGFAKKYEPKTEGSETYPPETQRVQFTARDLLTNVEKELVSFYDVTLTKDKANCNAKADIVVDGQVIAKDIPATHLLFLEKHLGEVKNFVAALPVLDPAESWKFDENASLYKSEATKTHRTKKIQKAIVLHPPTVQHPAQTQLITEDEVVGYWDTVKSSGALPLAEKQGLVDRVEALLRSVQKAREAANAVEAPDQHIGKSLFNYIIRNQIGA